MNIEAQTHLSTKALSLLQSYFQQRKRLAFAVLVGSQVEHRVHPGSDWDIAIQWAYVSANVEHAHVDMSVSNHLARLADMEIMRKELADLLSVTVEKIDLIDIASANLAMRELIANHGVVLTSAEALPWLYFLQRTWRDLEDYYWDDLYAA